MNTRQEILSDIDSNFPLYLSFLQTLIRAASPSPPGDTTEVAAVVLRFLSSHAISAQTIAPQRHMPNIVADFEGGDSSGPRVVLNGHIDTFPVANAKEWKHGGPFSGYNDGTSIYGRGGVDMKAGTAASIIAFSLLQKRAKMLRGSVALTVVSDEETGGKWGTRYLLDSSTSRWRGDCVINGEPGGLQSIRFGEKGTLRLTFTVRTRGANGAYKHLSRGANIIAAQLIQRLLEIESITPHLPEELRRHFDDPEVRRTADEIMGPGAAAILLAPTVNIGTIQGGLKVNVIPETCVFEADIRLPIGLTAEDVMNRISSILTSFPEASVVKQEAASNPANYCSVDHPLARSIASVTEDLTGQRPVQLAGLGGTDCKFYRYLGIPAYVIGPSPGSMGASGEAVDIAEFKTLIKIHTLAIWDYLGSKL